MYRGGWPVDTLLTSNACLYKKNTCNYLDKNKHSDMGTPEFLSLDEFTRFRSGDKQVFRKIYDEYYALVDYTLKRCRIVDDDAVDIIQETFFKLYRHRDSINHGSVIKSWLITTARNHAIDYLRMQKKQSTIPYEHAQDKNLGSNYSDPPSSIMHELEIALIGDLIDEITQQTGDDTFSLFYKEGLSTQEIARRHDEPLGTVTNRLSRLRTRFRERFKRKIHELRETHIC